MKRRIKQLLAGVSSKAGKIADEISTAPQVVTPELLEAIMRDLDTHDTLTYEEVAAKVGCSPEKVRLESKRIPGVIRATKPHRVTATAYRLLIERLAA